jgi:hypothetical protein
LYLSSQEVSQQTSEKSCPNEIQMGEVEEEIHCKEEGERVTEKHASKLCWFDHIDQILQNYKGRHGLLRGEDMEH